MTTVALFSDMMLWPLGCANMGSPRATTISSSTTSKGTREKQNGYEKVEGGSFIMCILLGMKTEEQIQLWHIIEFVCSHIIAIDDSRVPKYYIHTQKTRYIDVLRYARDRPPKCSKLHR